MGQPQTKHGAGLGPLGAGHNQRSGLFIFISSFIHTVIHIMMMDDDDFFQADLIMVRYIDVIKRCRRTVDTQNLRKFYRCITVHHAVHTTRATLLTMNQSEKHNKLSTSHPKNIGRHIPAYEMA